MIPRDYERHRTLIERTQRTKMGMAQQWRSAEHHAAYLLPYLKPGMRLLDVGCGPGSITRGLAQRVAPGQVVGLDLRRERFAAQQGVSNLTFTGGDVYRLPFADRSFDAAHAHALFQHLDDPGAALRELHRVLRPGGVIGIADWDRDWLLMYPESALLRRSFDWLSELRRREGGNPCAGRELARQLALAGFEQPVMGVSTDAVAMEPAAKRVAERWAGTFEERATRAQIVAAELADDDELRAVVDGWRAWGREPGALWGVHWFYAVAFR